jgi:Zn-dependent peptidase ImmA (M78 family)
MIKPKQVSELIIDRRKLAIQAMNASIAMRLKAGFDLVRPICVYEFAERLDVTVRFNEINMEGMYDRIPKPRIHLSALRPLVRRNFNCAHELGHHVFGHGSTIDELRDETEHDDDRPDELLANAFAAFVLIPTLGLRHALANRHADVDSLTPPAAYAIASNFAVGYATLINHLAYGLRSMSTATAIQLLRISPKAIRAELIGDFSSEHLVWVDEHWDGPTIDAEVDSHVLLPRGARTVAGPLELVRLTHFGHLYRAVRPGITRVEAKAGGWAAFVRIAKKRYVGLAKYRHLEQTDD